MPTNPPPHFLARDGRTYCLALSNSSTVIKAHDGLDVGESLHEYWTGPDDDSKRCYVSADLTRHTLD